jgi:16S rRNA processing protein RimM
VTFEKENLICVGILLEAKGLKGEVLIKYFAENPSTFSDYSYFFLGKEKKEYKVSNFSTRKEHFLVKLHGVDRRTEAEALKGKEVFIGLAVENSSDQRVGSIAAIYNFGAGDILEIKLTNNKLEMIPFTKDFVLEIILNDKIIIAEMDS